MSTQSVTAIVGNNSLSKVFSDTATDSQWDGNILLDTLGSNPLGILMPRTMINYVAVTYSAGACAWRIIDSVTLQVKRQGWASLNGYSDADQNLIQPYMIQPTDTLQVYPVPIDATIGESNALVWVTANGKTELYSAEGIANETPTAVTTVVNNQGIGDSIFGQVISNISAQVEDGGTLSQITITDNTGGVIYTNYGTRRGVTAGSRSNYFNIELEGLSIPVSKGFILKVETVSA